MEGQGHEVQIIEEECLDYLTKQVSVEMDEGWRPVGFTSHKQRDIDDDGRWYTKQSFACMMVRDWQNETDSDSV